MHKNDAAELFKVLGNPNRVKMLKILYNTESVSKNQFAKAFDYYTGTSDDGAYDDSGDDLDDWDEDDESTRLQKKESDEKNLLTIRSYEGDITIKTR